MTTSLISIIMPAYNAEKYITASIQSVQQQTWTNWELIIIDDCSSDQTPSIAATLKQQDCRIHYLRNPYNMGAAQSRNRGIQLAHGEWIAFLDSDDLWTPEKLEHQLAFALQMHSDFTFTGSSFINEESRPLSHCLEVPLHLSYQQLLKQNIISCSSVLLRKHLLQDHPMTTAPNIHEDFATWLSILRDYNIPAHGLNQPYLIYRISTSSKSGNKKKAALMTYHVYRHLGLSHPKAIYFWLHYFIRSINKYRKIK